MGRGSGAQPGGREPAPLADQHWASMSTPQTGWWAWVSRLTSHPLLEEVLSTHAVGVASVLKPLTYPGDPPWALTSLEHVLTQVSHWDSCPRALPGEIAPQTTPALAVGLTSLGEGVDPRHPAAPAQRPSPPAPSVPLRAVFPEGQKRYSHTAVGCRLNKVFRKGVLRVSSQLELHGGGWWGAWRHWHPCIN